MHALLIGRTRSGKTLLARQLTDEYARREVPSIVLDPIGDPRWTPAFHTADPAQFLWVAQHNLSCALWIDESGAMVGHHERELFWVAVSARHLGHNSHFICQRATQIAPTVRDQCEILICFAISDLDARDLAREWSCEELREASKFPQFHYLTVRRFGAPSRGIVTPPSEAVVIPIESHESERITPNSVNS